MRVSPCVPCVLALAPLVLCSPSACGQGSLTPPPGPPGPTMKTLAQIEPRTPISSLPFAIQVPGSYYVTTNLTGAAGSHGILVEANDVTLDLGGFTLSGAAGSLNGVHVAAARENLAVRNGTLRGWITGLQAPLVTSSQFESLRLFRNTEQGLRAGAASAISACTAYANWGIGISAGSNSRLSQASGFGNGLEGLFADSGSQVLACAASGNLGDGISVGSRCLIDRSVSENNAGSGIVAGSGVQISESKVSNNGLRGISAGADATIQRCSAAGNLDTGIGATQNAQVLECKAVANTRGIVVQTGAMIRGCATLQNSGDGILVGSECTVVGNTATGNFLARDAAGIHLAGRDNVVRENSLLSNDMGLLVDVAGNFIIQNSAANNSLNYRIVDASQAMGPVVSSSDVKNTTNPVANFEF
jgi:hypothetical protein